MDFINADTLYLCIDQGGHATRSIIFNHEGEQVASAFSEIETKYPAENFVEYDANEILLSVFSSIENVIITDVIESERQGQSQKPKNIYDIVEALVPDGHYLEIFSRRNNLRNFWVSIGLEL